MSITLDGSTGEVMLKARCPTIQPELTREISARLMEWVDEIRTIGRPRQRGNAGWTRKPSLKFGAEGIGLSAAPSICSSMPQRIRRICGSMILADHRRGTEGARSWTSCCPFSGKISSALFRIMDRQAR